MDVEPAAPHPSEAGAPPERPIKAGIDRGLLRADLDIDACIDLLNGALYYQFLVRGCGFDDPEARARTREAFETAWRGMLA